MKTKNDPVEDVALTLEKGIERATVLLQELRMARGTSDLTESIRQVTGATEATTTVPATPVQETLRDKIRRTLVAESLGLAALARAVREPVGPLSEEMRVLREEKLVCNVGSEEFPRWSWRIGDETSAKELRDVITKLISETPLTTRELSEFTGARFARVGGQLVEIQRSGANIVDLGNAITSRWFLLTGKARDARLPTKNEYRRRAAAGNKTRH